MVRVKFNNKKNTKEVKQKKYMGLRDDAVKPHSTSTLCRLK